MAGEHSFSIDFNELDKDIEKMMTEYPDASLKYLQKEARKWKKLANEKGYGKYTGGKRPIPKSWKNIKEENILHQATEIQIQNKAPHFHLVENGHVKWLFGRNTGGYVAGKHWAEQAREQFKDAFVYDTADYVDAFLKEHNL